MNVRRSYEIAEKIIKKAGSRNPDIICRSLGIELYECDLGNLKGMYSSADRHRTIYLNKRLTGYLRSSVFAHEIAHDQIPEHRKMARSKPAAYVGNMSESYSGSYNYAHTAFNGGRPAHTANHLAHLAHTTHPAALGHDSSYFEREANSVAAHILIDDEQMIELIMSDLTVQAIACELCVPIDLLLIELEDYRKMHPEYSHLIANLPRNGRGNYLKDYNDGTF